jgi:hypothetical protein
MRLGLTRRQAQHGVIREIGITQRLLVNTPTQQTYLLHHI